MSITPVNGLSVNLLDTPGALPSSGKAPNGAKSFVDSLKDSIGKVEQTQKSADRAIDDLAVGRTNSLHETMISVEQADISFKMLMAVRSKVINAYHEIMRMQF